MFNRLSWIRACTYLELHTGSNKVSCWCRCKTVQGMGMVEDNVQLEDGTEASIEDPDRDPAL